MERRRYGQIDLTGWIDIYRLRTAHKRFTRWSWAGVWEKIFKTLLSDLTTKRHTATDASGVPLHFILTGGTVSDFTAVPELIASVKAKCIIADKGYDSVVKRAFCRRKHYRCIATRYDRKAPYFIAFLHLAAAHIWG